MKVIGARRITNVELGLPPNFVANGVPVKSATWTFCQRRISQSRHAIRGGMRVPREIVFRVLCSSVGLRGSSPLEGGGNRGKGD